MRMNISVPDGLAEQVRARNLPISSICQDALRMAVDTERAQQARLPELIADVVRDEVRKALRAEIAATTKRRP